MKAALPQLRAAVPQSINMTVIADRTLTIRASVLEVKLTLMITIVAGGRGDLPLPAQRDGDRDPLGGDPRLAAGHGGDHAAGQLQPRQPVSLMALTIAVGFVVDDAIVMVEAIWRRIEHGQRPFEAALAGSREIGCTILTISISLIAVFTPLMFMGGVVGMMMREFALTLSAAVVISVILSLTLTPMLCAQLPKPARAADQRLHQGALETGFNKIETGYARGLRRGAWSTSSLTMAVFAFTLILTVRALRHLADRLLPAAGHRLPAGHGDRAHRARPSPYRRQGPGGDAHHRRRPRRRRGPLQRRRRGPRPRSTSPSARARTAAPPAPTEIINRLRPEAGPDRRRPGGPAGRCRTSPSAAARRAPQYQYTLSDGDLDELNEWAPRLVGEPAEAARAEGRLLRPAVGGARRPP